MRKSGNVTQFHDVKILHIYLAHTQCHTQPLYHNIMELAINWQGLLRQNSLGIREKLFKLSAVVMLMLIMRIVKIILMG